MMNGREIEALSNKAPTSFFRGRQEKSSEWMDDHLSMMNDTRPILI